MDFSFLVDFVQLGTRMGATYIEVEYFGVYQKQHYYHTLFRCPNGRGFRTNLKHGNY